MNKNNVVLIGMPGAGKSTVGVILAKVLGYQFIDADLVIQDREDRLLKDIIEEEGLNGFLQIENEVNASINTKETVIATGGSVVYGEEAMEHLKSIGTVVYIKLSYDTLDSRLGNIKQRGVALKDGQTLFSLYKERCPLYEKYADIVIDSENLGVEELLEKIKCYFVS
ncbi:MAG: shikimate kinase [bacterium]|nr:shikimate kinase [bacterium]